LCGTGVRTLDLQWKASVLAESSRTTTQPSGRLLGPPNEARGGVLVGRS
jgi:hypothetical protein